MFASNFDDFWALPSFGKPSQPAQPQQAPAPAQVPSQTQQAAPARSAKTMEEIEAELRSSRLQSPAPPSQPQQQQQEQAPQADARRQPMTMEEIEAQMRGSRQPSQPPMPMGYGGPPPQGPFPGMPPSMPAMQQSPLPPHMAQQQQQPPPPQVARGAPPGQAAAGQPPSGPTASDFPPLGTAGPRAPPVSLPGGPTPPSAPPSGPPSAAALQAQQAEHFARMQGMLRALPEPVQSGITALHPRLHFDVLQGICSEFAVLLQPPSSDQERQIQKQAEEAALGRLRMVERFEKKRAAREAKIMSLSRHNGLMSVSDKEFITRIQISQILPNDPYADDFYAHIYFALHPNMAGFNPGMMGAAPQQPQRQQPPTGPAKGRKGVQRMNAQQKAMLRMQQQVARLVADRKTRIEKSAQGTVNPNLEGALGKIGGPVKAGNPRQALQINQSGDNAGSNSGAATAADAVRQALQGASLGASAGASGQNVDGGQRPALTRHEALRILEKLYDIVMSLEQLRREVGEDGQGSSEQEALTATLWKELRILEPLEISDPHPFVSLLNTIKGKRLLPRALRHLSSEQTLTAMTMIVASFDTLDVVRDAAVLDDVSSIVSGALPSERKNEAEAQSDIFSNSIVPAMLMLMTNSPFKIVIGMLALFVERNDIVRVVRSKPGIAFLTILLSRAEALKQGGNTNESQDAASRDDSSAAPTPDEQAQWSSIFQLLFERLVTGSGGLSNLFPSNRAKQYLPFGVNYNASGSQGAASLQSSLDESDEPVWNLYAAMAVSSTMEQQSILVQELREKILENVLEARSKADSAEGARKLRLVNIFLNALNLDHTQITV